MERQEKILLAMAMLCCALLIGFLQTEKSTPTAVSYSEFSASQQADVSQAQQRVNLNTATAEQLCLLPGVGEMIAGRILAYRAEHGAFSAVDELLEIDGISEQKLALLREQAVAGAS